MESYFITLSEIFSFANATATSRNFVEGERLIHAKPCHIIYVGKTSEDEETISLIGFCLQTSHLTQKPHEINIIIKKNGKISSARCTCAAGLSEKCKHIVGMLIYCSRNDLSKISVASCTDKKCTWGTAHTDCLEDYAAVLLDQHKCFKEDKISHEKLKCTLSEEQDELITKLLCTAPQSALLKHTCGRHAPKLPMLGNPMVPDPTIIEAIFENQSSVPLQTVSEIPFQPLQECCQSRMDGLNNDSYYICEQTQSSYKLWQKERQFRITGSRCYEIFTYTKNKNPDWERKSFKYFYPQQFINKCIKHGLKYEKYACMNYEEITNQKVDKFGLVVPPSNCWLGYSPDGIIFQDNKPKKLLEIKCPYEGKDLNVQEVTKKLKYLETDGSNNLILKKKHAYYAQVQMGMAVLNVAETDFVLFSSFDKSLIIIPIKFDVSYATQLLISLKHAYFNYMIHYTCKQ